MMSRYVQDKLERQKLADVPQLLKWIGNKHRFAEEIVSYMPEEIHTYVEPFLGSGAVLGKLAAENRNSLFPRYKQAIGGDILPFLIGIFEYVKNDPDTLVRHYEACIKITTTTENKNIWKSGKDSIKRSMRSILRF